MTKRCYKCGCDLALTAFWRGQKRCKDCMKAASAKWRAKNPGYQAAWCRDNPEKVKASAKRYRANNLDTLRGKDKEKYHRNREASVRRVSEYNKRNRHKRAAAERKRRQNPMHALHGRVSASIRQSLRTGKGGVKWGAILGYTIIELAQHLERQFSKGMTWENMGEWHIDHITPLASFDITGPDCPELRAAWALTNLRPLWATENIRKRDKRTHLL